MWSQILLCALVGLATASDYGWKSNTEYMYKVHGRTLTGLHEVANQYSGMVMKANLIVRPQSDGILMAKMSDAKYAQVHTELPEGWRSEIPEGKLNYQQLPISDKVFQIVLKNGVVHDIIVSKEVQNWEANFLKSIVSQIQLDTQGEHVIKSHVNQLPEEGSNNAVFKTMEKTITGQYETLYDISPLPEYILQSQPWLVPMPQMKGDGEFIEIVKNKNFSRSDERVGYHFGLGQNGEWEPSTNQMGEFFLRSSVSRAIISGNLKRYTIQSSTTTNKIILSPTLNSEQKGMVVSHLNLTLSHVQPASSQFEQLQQPQHLGSLVYRYSSPFSGSHEARSHQQRSQESRENVYSSEETSNNMRQHYRNRRSAHSAEQQYNSLEESQDWSTQDQPKLQDAPESPLLPMYIGYKGKSIKSAQQVNIVQAVQKIAQQIGHELQRPEHIPKEQTLAKFTILSSLTRIMSEKEMQEAAHNLYTKENEGPKTDAWKVYRDAVAQCGTGPALLIIQDWIQTRKIQTEEAAEVIASMAQSVRQPTEEYMRAFYTLATKEEVKQQVMLNTTAILSFASLVRKVYVDEQFSHNQYPVHSFGTFRKSSGKEFVAQEVVPYLKQQLNKAIEHADSEKIQVYIRALGNVAHQSILAVFEPYLEGDKQVSQFQRLQIVLAFDKFAQIYPKIARGVLYKIYQNAGDVQEVRAAAVYQLMHTCPPASMLQRMAQYTNVDTDEYVNAAVKSAIESAAELKGEQYSELSENARSAEPLLTKQTYGVQYSRNYLRSYVVDEMNMFYKQHMHVLGSQDSSIPKGIRYGLGLELNGVQSEILTLEGMVSSIDELTNVFQQQTEIHNQHQQQQKQNHQQAQQSQWSSESIARLLNIQNEEREQFEGNMLFKLGSGATRFFSFDNQTVELLPRALREIEDMLRSGEKIQYTKFLNREDITISFPTEMSLPFFYTLDAPTLLHISGEIRATAEPKISSGDKLHKPHTITAHAQIRAVVSTKVQAKLGFVTPFDHQQYVSGFDKNVHVNIPMKSEIEIDIKNKQMKIEFQPLESEKNSQVLHYSTWPYTAKHDILKLEPLAGQRDTKIVYSTSEPIQFQHVFGRKAGMAFRVEYTSEQKFMDSHWIYEQYRRHDAISALLAPYFDETIQHTQLNIEYDAQQSTSHKVQIRMAYEKRYETEQSNESNAPNADIREFSKLPRETKARQQQFAKMASAGIHSAVVRVYDVAVQFDGESKVEYTATAAVAQGPVDEKARVLFYLKKHSANEQESKPYELAMSAKARVPNTNGLDYKYALEFDPTSTAQVELAFGQDLKSATKFNLNAKFEQSESRKHYLQTSDRAHECRREMEQGNKQLPACANMTQEANLLDRVHVQVHVENMTPKVRNMTQKMLNAVRYLSFYNFEENNVNAQGNGKEDQFDMEAHFNPDFESVNVTLRSHKYEAMIKNIRVNNFVKQIVVIHPVFSAYSRVMSDAFEYDTYRPFCVVDKTAANTFDNKTYPIDLGNAWHLMLQYVPTFARHHQHHQHQKYQQQQQEQQTEQFAVLVRESKSGKSQKEVKITIRTPESQGQLVEIEMQPAGQQGQYSGSNPAAKVLVNQKQYQYNDKKSTDIEGGLIKIYALPNGEVKVEVRDNFYVIYDGERVKISTQHDKFRDAVRGLCGTFSGEESDDFLTPKNCILRNPLEFASTYAVEQQGRVQEYQSRAEKSTCYEKNVEYTNVISDYDVGRSHQQYRQRHNQHKSGSDSCTKHQTQYVKEGSNQVCFTIRPIPVCKSSCNASNTIKKSVPVHCVERNNVSELWVNQIQKGASPDFSQKSATKTLKIEVPETCSKY